MARETFYNDLSDDEARMWISKLNKQATQSLLQPATWAAWRHVPSSYLVCGKDNAIPAFLQDMMIAQEGANFDVTRFEDCSHSPFLSRPEETAEFIRSSIEKA